MIESIRIARLGTSGRLAATAAAALLLAGCVTYSQAQLSGMNTVDLCELQQIQGPNLSPETKAAMQGELSRRNESCGKYSAVLAERYADFMFRETYGRQDDP
jgi:hypothetical protein